MLTKPQVFYDNAHKQALGYQNPFYLKKAQRIKPTLYDGIVISDKHVAMLVIVDEETLILEEESQSKMSEKEKDLEAIKQKNSHKPIDYVKLNQLSEDFGKRFVPQQELSAEQAFWYHMSNPSTKSSDASPVKMEAPKELPKVSLVNESLKKLKFHLVKFDNVVKIRTTPDAHTEGEWGFKHTKVVFNNEIIPFLKSLKDIFNVFDKDLLNEIMEVQIVFDQMEAVVQQSLVFKDQFDSIKKTRVCTKEQSDSLIDKLNLKSAKNEDLKAQIQDKVFVITSLKNDLRKVKGKEIVDIAAQIPSANTIVPGMFKLDLEPLAPRLLQNREAHIDYLKYTQEQADILQEIVKQAKAKQPLDNELDFACKHAQQIQDLLVYVRDTCPNAIKLSAKKVVVTPKNNVKKVRFAEPLTSSSNIKQPTDNKKNDKISQTPSRNMKIKVEAQPRKVNKKNRVGEPIHDVNVKHSLLNANSKLIYATCKKSMFDGCPDCSLVSGLQMFETYDREPLSAHELSKDGLVGYAPAKKAFRIYNKRTQKIIETIHVTFDELTPMASKQFSSGPGLHMMTPATSSSGLVPNPVS
ncbi:hypothetical protein Tco_0602460 [Tanacetum coccineum]